jgi:hypothetical protein
LGEAAALFLDDARFPLVFFFFAVDFFFAAVFFFVDFFAISLPLGPVGRAS